jgi:glycosidase
MSRLSPSKTSHVHSFRRLLSWHAILCVIGFSAFVLINCNRCLADDQIGSIPHTFQFTPPAGADKPQSMAVAGDFNQWNTSANVMTEKDGVYTATISLTPGQHYYKFVENGSTWLNDPKADPALQQPDGQGGNNSGVVIGAGAPAVAPAVATAQPGQPADAAGQHTFIYTTDAGAASPASVAVAGDFNGWSTTANPMTLTDGAYRATVTLTPGVHAYKFVVNGSEWHEDPKADPALRLPDGQGGNNSGLTMPAVGAAVPTPAPAAAPAAPVVGGVVDHTFEFTAPDKTTSVILAGDFNNWSTTATPMIEKDGVYRVTIKLAPGFHLYKFLLNGSDWTKDPKGDPKLEQADGQGGFNSGVSIDAPDPAAPAPEFTPPLPPAPDRKVGQGAGRAYLHEFFYAPPANQTIPSSVAVVGDFNGWSQSANPMQFSQGAFRAPVQLTQGVHFYKLFIDGRWTNDPASDAELEESDGFGGKNSAVLVGPDGRNLPAPQPNTINADAVSHDPDDVKDLDVIDAHSVRVSIQCQASGAEAINLLLQGADGKWSRQSMYKMLTQLGFDSYSTLFTVADNVTSVKYAFELINGSAHLYVAGGKQFPDDTNAEASAYQCDLQPTYTTPDWAKNAVWYQIFPERFRNGDPSNDPPNTVKWTSDWWSTLPGESGKLYNDVWKRRYGGDFQGIIAELPYLRSLGVTAIYLNPIFKAEDLHKYDTSDYRHVDDHFGFAGDIDALTGETDDPKTWQWTRTDKLFLDFVAEAHKQGFKVIIDGVFNHTGIAFYAFQDVMKNGKASRYADWYNITSWDPLHWAGWGGSKDGALPEFKKDAQLGLVHGPRELVMDITRRWLAPDGDPSRGVDGFRLDVADNIPRPFWIDWRKLCKSLKPDAYLDAEIWSINPGALRGDEFDATMDYPFAQAMESFFVDQKNALSPSSFGRALNQLFMSYPLQSMFVEQNLVDSHDTDRWASRFVNPDLRFNAQSRIQDSNPDYNRAKPRDTEWTRMKQSLVVQFTWAGAPMIYYGDEAGMWGPSDPSNRQPMIWRDLQPYDDPQVTFKQDLFDQYQRLIAIRAAQPELRRGLARTLLADDADGVFAFARDLDEHHAAIVVNRSDKPEDVNLSFGPADRDVDLTDWLDDSSVSVAPAPDAPDGRPAVAVKAAAATVRALHGTTHLTLPAWGSAILSADWN